ncbi:MAG TPA: DEAD/DEAH box helicase [Pseudogracilibacillus sp.]|nr:DEAD/DEAH box helicase [Pseudogracilibacillus sp.]
MVKYSNLTGEGETLLPNPLLNPSLLNSPIIFLLAKQYAGKLLLREEISIDSTVFDILVTNRLFMKLDAMQVSMRKLKCMRCQGEDKHFFAQIDCARCGSRHEYCRNCIQMGRVLRCAKLYYWNGPVFPWPRHEKACKWEGKLTLAQSHAAKAMLDIIKEQGKILCWAVTGAGKTEMIFPAIEKVVSAGQRVCIATPRTDVVRELFPRIQQAFPNVTTQALYGASEDKVGDAQIVVSTTHQLFRYREAFSLMIVDEVDAFPYYYDETLQSAVKRASKTDATTILLTATPRKDIKRKIKQRRLKVVFVPVRYHQQALPLPRTIYIAKLHQSLEQQHFPKKIKQWLINRSKPQRQILFFAPTVVIANEYEATIRKVLLKLEYIREGTEVATVHAGDEARPEKIKAFRERQLGALITTTILERGVTFPSIDVVILNGSHHVFDEAALVQIAGRAGRSKDDPTGEVVIFHEGLTDDIVAALASIKQMNRRRTSFLKEWGDDN